jgi:hypothetical protein
VGRYDPRSSAATLYIIRLLCRIEEFITLILQQTDTHTGTEDAPANPTSALPPRVSALPPRGGERGETDPPPSAPSSLSRLRPPAAVEQELRRSRATIRAQLDGSAFPMLQAWFTRAMREHQVRWEGGSRGVGNTEAGKGSTEYRGRGGKVSG